MDGEGSECIGVDGDVGAGAGIGIGLDRNAMKGSGRVWWSGWRWVVRGGQWLSWCVIPGWTALGLRFRNVNATHLPNFAILKKSASFRRPLHSFLPMPAADVGPWEGWSLALPHDLCALRVKKKIHRNICPAPRSIHGRADIGAHRYIDAWGTLQHALVTS